MSTELPIQENPEIRKARTAELSQQRIAWLKRHGVEIKNNGNGVFSASRNGVASRGVTEDDAILKLCKQQKIKHWTEEAYEAVMADVRRNPSNYQIPATSIKSK